MQPLMTVEELAQFLQIHPETARRLTREGKIPHLQVGGAYRYDRELVSTRLAGDAAPDAIVDAILDLIQCGVSRDPWLAWNSVNDAFDGLRKKAQTAGPLALVPLLAQLADKAYARATLPAPERRAPQVTGFIDEAGTVERLDNWDKAPWLDFSGALIHHGDVLAHPDGSRFVALRLPGVRDPADAWRAVYCSDGPAARLCLQIGDKGQAQVVDV